MKKKNILLLTLISVEDTEHWRRELTRIAEMVGLVTAEDLAEIDPKKETNNLRRSPSAVSKLSEKTPLKSSFGEYSQRTGRWNETPKGLSRSRSLNRRTPLSAIVPNHLFCVDEQEREMWVRIIDYSTRINTIDIVPFDFCFFSLF